MSKWKDKMIGLAEHVAQWSKDDSTKVGAVVINERGTVLSLGYNEFSRGVRDNVPERRQRPLKYKFTPHAEANAVYNAAAEGISLDGGIMFVTLCPCSSCANAIVQSGIRKVYAPKIDPKNERDQRWKEEFDVSMVIFEEGNVEIEFYEKTV